MLVHYCVCGGKGGVQGSIFKAIVEMMDNGGSVSSREHMSRVEESRDSDGDKSLLWSKSRPKSCCFRSSLILLS